MVDAGSNGNGRHRQMLTSTVGAVFLGTPLRGTPYANATNLIMTVSGILGMEPEEGLVRDLTGNTGVLRDLLKQFAALIRQPWLLLEIKCVFETKKTQMVPQLRQSGWFSKTGAVLVCSQRTSL